MQQVLQPIDGQATEVAEVPAPICGPNEVLIANRASLISAGTERSTVSLAKTSLLQKAKQRPDHVRRVLEKVRQEGLANTIRQVRAKLATPMPLGYSSAGVVLEVGENVRGFQRGDRVASNGPHAGIVAVGQNLVAHIPDSVPFDHACYAVIGSIALQGVRLAKISLGDVVAVIGLGLIGQITVALLKSAGCTVIGTDLDASKRELALQMGADHVADAKTFDAAIRSRSNGYGADAVLITASTSSNGPIETAASVARPKGRIVAVGAVGMEIPRREFYPKELEFIVSCSYGPGRYDAQYEEQGYDYPYAYVRWTEQRNIQAVLDQMAANRLPVEKLTTHRFPIADAVAAYKLVEEGFPSVGIVLEYPVLESCAPLLRNCPTGICTAKPATARQTVNVSMVGAGNFATATLIPTFAQTDAVFRGVVSAGGVTSRTVAKKYGFGFSSTDINEVLADRETDAVVIATRHHQHTPMAIAALRAGKHVFLEKPLAISEEQLEEWTDAFSEANRTQRVVMVGFNRRFSPLAGKLRTAFETVFEPRTLLIRFNAGRIPAEHWIHDPEVGGGRIIGEACHAIDLALYLIGSPVVKVHAFAASASERGRVTEDDVSLVMRHHDGSLSTIAYVAGGDRSTGKERVEMFGRGQTGILDDWRSLTVTRQGKRVVRHAGWSQQKGYSEEVHAFLQACRTGVPPIPFTELAAVCSASLRAVQSLRLELPLEVA